MSAILLAQYLCVLFTLMCVQVRTLMAEAPSPLPKFDGTPPMGYLWLWMGRWVRMGLGVSPPCRGFHAGASIRQENPCSRDRRHRLCVVVFVR